MKSVYLFSLIVIFSCQDHTNKKLDDAIKKYNETDFYYFKNVFIGIREKNRGEVTYVIEKSEGNLPVYFVRYSIIEGNVVEINRAALEKENVEDYFTDFKLKELVGKFRELDLKLLHVDNEGNVYINPFEINKPAILLRLASSSNENEVRKGYVYERYKGNWYIRK